MAPGHWVPGTHAVDERIEMVVDRAGRVVHCGIGYAIAAPDGTVLKVGGGHTWGGPDSQPPEPWRSRLQAFAAEIRRERDQVEGLTSGSS